jgi:purine-nucleoside/S-methyl-5'-thioadenosine phosphorylase / adenosine deaminase
MLLLTAPNLKAAGIAHGFFGRQGGVSEGFYASLNCGPGSSDDRAKVTENRRRATAALSPAARLVTCYQVHSGTAVTVTRPWEVADNPKADAMATAAPGIALGILTADCIPILFADPKARVIGAAHAGWGGAFQGVAESAIAAMEGLGAARADIRAALGPCIRQAAYEVGPEFEARFADADPKNRDFFVPAARAGHWRFDLPGYAARRLAAAGIAAIETLPHCTYAEPESFFSFRRATHAKEPDYGRQLSAIVMSL